MTLQLEFFTASPRKGRRLKKPDARPAPPPFISWEDDMRRSFTEGLAEDRQYFSDYLERMIADIDRILANGPSVRLEYLRDLAKERLKKD